MDGTLMVTDMQPIVKMEQVAPTALRSTNAIIENVSDGSVTKIKVIMCDSEGRGGAFPTDFVIKEEIPSDESSSDDDSGEEVMSDRVKIEDQMGQSSEDLVNDSIPEVVSAISDMVKVESFAKKRTIDYGASSADIDVKNTKLTEVRSSKCPRLENHRPTLVCALCRRLFQNDCVCRTTVRAFVCPDCYNINAPESGAARDVPDGDVYGPLQNDRSPWTEEPIEGDSNPTLPYPVSLIRANNAPQQTALPARRAVNISPPSMPVIPTTAVPDTILPSSVEDLTPQPSSQGSSFIGQVRGLGKRLLTPVPVLPTVEPSLFRPKEGLLDGKRGRLIALPDGLVEKMRRLGQNSLLVNGTPIVVQSSDLVWSTVGYGLMIKPGTIDTTLPNHMISVSLADGNTPIDTASLMSSNDEHSRNESIDKLPRIAEDGNELPTPVEQMVSQKISDAFFGKQERKVHTAQRRRRQHRRPTGTNGIMMFLNALEKPE